MELILWFFFFQAEDGIRDRDVTGVQTCALPISRGRREAAHPPRGRGPERRRASFGLCVPYPLPALFRANLRGGGAAAPGGRAGALQTLPHSDRRASPATSDAAARPGSVENDKLTHSLAGAEPVEGLWKPCQRDPAADQRLELEVSRGVEIDEPCYVGADIG